jgi:hypothetical protein
MNPERVKASLKLIRKVYRRILDDASQAIVLPSAIASVDATKQEYDYAVRNRTRGFTPEPWGYTIAHDQPLRFIPSKPPGGIEMQVDIFCDVRWTEDEIPVRQDIKVRIWSDHDETIFDPERDAQTVYDQLIDPVRTHRGRVVSRFHFDKADPGQKQGPEYHLQFGGKPESYELCWHPKKVNVPRLDYRPIELFLTCQIIAANFFWEDYLEIREKREWREELITYQDLLLENHYENCLDLIRNHESLLDSLWVT